MWHNIIDMKTVCPQAVIVCLWSYDVSKLDQETHKKLIITQVLNHVTKEATDWFFDVYSKNEIKNTVQNPLPGMWNKKSLNLWLLVFLGKSVLSLPSRFTEKSVKDYSNVGDDMLG